MSILNNETTQEQKIDNLKTDITKKSNRLYQKIKREHEKIFNMIWNNPTVSPQEILDSYGEDAIDLFTYSSSLQDLLYQVDDTYVALVPPNEWELDEYGVVIVGDEI